MASTDKITTDGGTLEAQIAETAQALRRLTQRSHQTTWHVCPEALSVAEVFASSSWQTWPLAALNDRQHVAWPRGQQVRWLCQQMTVPPELQGFPLKGLSLRLGLTWWAEIVEIYVDGELVQAGDLFDYFARIPLSDRVTPGDTFTIAIYLVSPGHDDGALVRTEAIYETTNADLPEPGFVADELTVLSTYAKKLAPEKLTTIAAAIAPLDWSTVEDQAQFLQELAALRSRLQSLSPWIKQRQMTCVGHAHLDLAWLWPVADTWRAAERTFRSVLSLQAAFPELTYTHSSPALFDWLERHRPDLFQAVLTAVKQGRWSIDAGLWVEPELNTLGGESLARQILYGQRYSQSRFGQESAIAWLPDSFGFSWQLPQLLTLGGIRYFATQKLRWNEATQFPHELFWWQGLDGTKILSLTLPPIGADVDPGLMASHGAAWEAQTGCAESLWLPGMGDHGGGPTRDMLQKARRWAASPYFPHLTFASPEEHLQRLENQVLPPSEGDQRTDSPLAAAPSSSLPIWGDELYLELHRGCYTVHADQKWYNRRCEDALREAELFAAIAYMQGARYPQATLEAAWKRVLFNQFHDILPGTAIPEVFETANTDWQWAYETAKAVRTEALAAIAAPMSPPSPPTPKALPLYCFNALNWEQTDLVAIALSALPSTVSCWQVVDAVAGEAIASQLSAHTVTEDTPPGQPEISPPSPHLHFLATVPPVGYRLYWLVPAGEKAEAASPTPATASAWTLENACLRAEIDPTTGNLVALVEKVTGQTVVRSPSNQLQAFRDAGQYWDAWDIAPDYEQHPLPAARLIAIEWLEKGPLRQRLRVVRQIAQSTLQQDYVLDAHVPYLQVHTVADWQATQVVLKAAFPLSFDTEQATYEIPFGAIARPTRSTDPHEQAKWEVPAYRWADMSNGEVGLSLLTDYKHGFDAKPDQLRLTLLKAPLWPDPQADRGHHRFTYALYPHPGDWRTAKTPNWAIAFNASLQTVQGQPLLDPETSTTKSPAEQGSFLDLGTDGVHLAALKRAEDDDERYILRLWELYGRDAVVTLPIATVESTDLLERTIAADSPTHLRPWQIATLKTSALIDSASSTSRNGTAP